VKGSGMPILRHFNLNCTVPTRAPCRQQQEACSGRLLSSSLGPAKMALLSAAGIDQRRHVSSQSARAAPKTGIVSKIVGDF